MNFREFLAEGTNRRKLIFLGLAIVLVIVMAGIVVREKYPQLWARLRGRVTTNANGDVVVPTIVGGELVLPKVAGLSGGGSLTGVGVTGNLGVVSANLIGIFDQQTQQLSAIRIIGEATNQSGRYVSAISPVIRFIDANGKTISQKVADLTNGFVWHDLAAGEVTYYDVSVAGPPTSDKLEIVLNSASSSATATYEDLKVVSRNIEIKTATYQAGSSQQSDTSTQGTASGQATGSAEATASAAVLPGQIEYYTVTGSVFNPLSDPVTGIAVYTWVKDSAGNVFGFGSQQFVNDLIMPNNQLDFHINVLPLKSGQKYDNYEIQVWGRRYRLNL